MKITSTETRPTSSTSSISSSSSTKCTFTSKDYSDHDVHAVNDGNDVNDVLAGVFESNHVYHQDCLPALAQLPDACVDLVYLDPPFFTQRTHRLKNKQGEEFSFSDSWESLADYLEFIRLRLIELKRVLKPTGNLFLHCDVTANHHLRLVLDQVFGKENFQSEIIWTYKRWSNAKKGLLDAHQHIYHYSKSKDFKFNILYGNYSETTNLDQILQDRVRNSEGKAEYKLDAQGNPVINSPKKGVPLSDVWEIPFLNPKAKERVGYPTQKPLLLLERILEIGSDAGDLVLDPCCGSGTTLVAAKLLGRRYLGFDKNEHAVSLAEQRLANPIKTNSAVLDKGRQSYDQKSPEEKQILAEFDCDLVQRNNGLDAVLRYKIDSSLAGIKLQKPQQTLTQAASLLKTAMEKRGFSRSILVQTQPLTPLEQQNFTELKAELAKQGIILIQTLKVQLG